MHSAPGLHVLPGWVEDNRDAATRSRDWWNEDGARTGGSRTRIAASCVHTVRPSSGIGSWCGDAVLCRTLIELRDPAARGQRPCAPIEDGRAGETRTRGLQIR